MRTKHPSFGIIGSGFSGSLLAVHLLRRLPKGCRVTLIDHRPGFGLGLAYSTANPSHLLNVRASRMSAFEDDPDHFLRWLATQSEALVRADDFVPRGLYGRYVQSLLAEQVWAEESNHGLYLFPDEAVDISVREDGAIIRMACGRSVTVDVAILAVGNFPPEVPCGGEGLNSLSCYVADPWAEGRVTDIPPTDSVLVIGSGLTMVDLVLNLLDKGHQGPLIALSRRGVLPHRHVDGVCPVPWDMSNSSQPLSHLLRDVRRRAKTEDWRSVVDGLRSHFQGWWQDLSLADKRRFLRHLRPWWDSHRHRMAPAVAKRLDDALESGKLTVLAGRIAGVSEKQEGVAIAFRPRGGGEIRSLTVGHVVNCSGPSSDYGRVAQPLLRRLLDEAKIRPDMLRLGLDVDSDLRLTNGLGQSNDRLYALGPITRGRFWEITAVPEIRRQARWLAEHLAGQRF
jgi:uncharacterized NAD(P)/FAD-binding protein YdhS